MKKYIFLGFALLVSVLLLAGCDMLADESEIETATPEASGTVPTETVSTEIVPPTGVDNYIDSYYATSVSVTDPNGNSYSDDGNGNLLDMLLKITKNAERSVYLGFSVDASKFYKAVFDGPAGPVTYKFYFSSSPEECYFESGSGRYYKSNKDGCIDFFNSPYSEGAYSLSEYPVLQISSKNIAPTEMLWEYKRYDGVYKAPDVAPVLGGQFDLGSVAANVKFNFSIQPSSVTVEVKNTAGTVLYQGDQSGLANISLKGDTDVIISVKAVWEKQDDKFCAGSASYDIKAKLGPSAIFSIDRTSAKYGEFIVMTCPNTSVDLKEIKVTMDPAIDFEPVFYSDGKQLKAFLPIPLLLKTTNNRVVYTVTAYGNSQTFVVNLKQRTDTTNFTISMITKDTLDIVGVTADPYKKIYADIEADIKKNTTFSRIYKQNGFELGYDQTLRARFGDNLKYSPLGSTLYASHDYSWVGTFLKDVVAVSDGRVVYVGEHDYTGGLVVVDHGMGLLSWYWNLSTTSIEVYEGQEIKQGAVIGNNGGGGLTENYNSTNVSVHIGLTVFDIPVDIAQLLK